MGQSATAFGNIHDSLSFFRNNYDAFAAFRAAIIRLHGLVDANEQGRAIAQGDNWSTDDGSVRAGPHRGAHTDRRAVDRSRSTCIWPAATRWWSSGSSGVGKTTLLRSLAELWPFASGTLCRPDGDNETMFLSQLPYVPLGNLRGVVCYPNEPGDISDDTLREVLTKVALAPLSDRLDDEAGLGQGALAG